MPSLFALLSIPLFFSSVSAINCPYDVDFAARIIPPGCSGNSTVVATGCCWYVFASYLYAAIRYANLSDTAFLPEELAISCTKGFSDQLVRRGLVAPSLVLTGDRCNLAGDPVKFAAGNRPCQFSKISDVYSAVDLSNATKQCSGTRRNLTTDQDACVNCQDAVIAATFSLFDATGSKEIVPCGMAATMGIWASSIPDVDRFVSYAICLVQILENIGNLGTGNILPSPSPKSPAQASFSGDGSRKLKITAGSISLGIIILAGASFIILTLIRRKRKSAAGATSDMELTAPIQRPLPTDGLYIFTKSELHRATSGFHNRNLLGEGGAAKVYLGTLPSGQQIAVKRIHRKKSKLNEFYREVEIVYKLRHRRLATLVGYCLENKNHALVFEYMPGGNLSAALTNGTLSWHQRLLVAADVAEALAYLHGLPDGGVIHRDVKPNNILLGEDGRAKLTDFGVAKVIPPEMTHARTEIKGTCGYVDPEYVAGGVVSRSADVYSYGVMLLQLVSGTKAVVSTPSGGQESIVEIVRGDGSGAAILDPRLRVEVADEESVEEVFRLAERCVSPEKIHRPKMTEVLAELRRFLAGNSPLTSRDPAGAGEDDFSPTTSSSF